MSFDSALLDLMPATVRVSTRASHNNYGEAAFASSTTSYSARIVEKRGFVRSAAGEDQAYHTVAWIRSTGTASITVTDRITLPTGIGPSTRPPVVGVERYTDEDGVHHSKVMFGY